MVGAMAEGGHRLASRSARTMAEANCDKARELAGRLEGPAVAGIREERLAHAEDLRRQADQLYVRAGDPRRDQSSPAAGAVRDARTRRDLAAYEAQRDRLAKGETLDGPALTLKRIFKRARSRLRAQTVGRKRLKAMETERAHQ